MFFKDSHKLEYLMASDATSISISTTQGMTSLLTRFALYNTANAKRKYPAGHQQSSQMSELTNG